MCLQAPRIKQAFRTRGMRGLVHFNTNDCILKKWTVIYIHMHIKNVLDRLQRVATIYMRYQCIPDTTSKSCNIVVVHIDTLLLCFLCPTADPIRTPKGINFSLHIFQNVRSPGLFVKRCASTGVKFLDAIRILITQLLLSITLKLSSVI
jgi:hypothetical protein